MQQIQIVDTRTVKHAHSCLLCPVVNCDSCVITLMYCRLLSSPTGKNKLIFSLCVCVFFRNILVDKPNDQSSRWSSESNYPPQVCRCCLHKLCPHLTSLVQMELDMRVDSAHLEHILRFREACGLFVYTIGV